MLKPQIALLLLLFLLSFGASGQNKKGELSLIEKTFPDQNYYSAKEEQNFEFDINDNNLEIEENFTTLLFTPEDRTDRHQVMFYDDYSEIKKTECTVSSGLNPNLNVVYTNYQNDGIFHDDLKICAFKMDMIKNVNYKVKYTKIYKNARFFTRFFFHENYPIGEKTISFLVPDWLKIDIMPVNFKGYDILETRTPSGKSTKITYTIKNAMPMPHEQSAPGSLKYLPHLLIFVKSYENGRDNKTFFTDHADVYKWNKTLVEDVINNESDLKPILANIIKNETDSFKMMEKIFYWVQDNVRYIAFEEGIMGYKPAPAAKVCNLLYGDCKGMANLTKTLLKMAGFDSRLTWIGTDDIPYDNNLPTLAVYNHMICTVIFKNKKYFLDATESYIAINDYAERIQGRPCMIYNGATFITEKIPDLSYDRNLHNENYTLKIQDNVLTGKSSGSFSGETKTSFLRHFNDERSGNGEITLKKHLSAQNQNITVKNISTSDINDRVLPLKVSYDFTLKNSILHSGNHDLLIFVNKDKELTTLHFDSTRVCDYVFNSKYYINTNCSLEIPADQQVKKIPDPVLIDNPAFSFNLKYEKKNDVVVLTKVIKIKTGYVVKADFIAWNNAITQANHFYNSPLILSKK